MPQSVTYYPHQNLIYLRVYGVVSSVSLATQVADWMYDFAVPAGYNCLTDTREMLAMDRPVDGLERLVNLQARAYRDLPSPDRSAILATTPVGFVVGRLFQQQAEGVLREQVQVFRNERKALAFVGIVADTLDGFLAAQTDGVNRC